MSEKVKVDGGIFVPEDHEDYDKVSDDEVDIFTYDIGDIIRYKDSVNRFVLIIDKIRGNGDITLTGTTESPHYKMSWGEDYMFLSEGGARNKKWEKVGSFLPCKDAFDRVPKCISGELIIIKNTKSTFLKTEKMLSMTKNEILISDNGCVAHMPVSLRHKDIYTTGINVNFHDLKALTKNKY